ncbi:hypothetical protein HK104_001870 [Borealophlyctis nickersoniae]|nr:hypothetical protein HK104_001870 [Borealophlyctis nickersoniae]
MGKRKKAVALSIDTRRKLFLPNYWENTAAESWSVVGFWQDALETHPNDSTWENDRTMLSRFYHDLGKLKTGLSVAKHISTAARLDKSKARSRDEERARVAVLSRWWDSAVAAGLRTPPARATGMPLDVGFAGAGEDRGRGERVKHYSAGGSSWNLGTISAGKEDNRAQVKLLVETGRIKELRTAIQEERIHHHMSQTFMTTRNAKASCDRYKNKQPENQFEAENEEDSEDELEFEQPEKRFKSTDEQSIEGPHQHPINNETSAFSSTSSSPAMQRLSASDGIRASLSSSSSPSRPHAANRRGRSATPAASQNDDGDQTDQPANPETIQTDIDQDSVDAPEPTIWSEWVLSSGKDVGKTVAAARENIPKKNRLEHLLWWGIIDVTGGDTYVHKWFTEGEIDEMRADFARDVFLAPLSDDQADKLIQLFDDLTEVARIAQKPEELLDMIERLTYPEFWVNEIRRTITSYTRNLIRRKYNECASEGMIALDFTNLLLKGTIDTLQKCWKADEGEISCLGSASARNAERGVDNTHVFGQKLDYRITLKDTVDGVEGLVGFRSGGLPRPGWKKFWTDKVDLGVCLRDILHSFFVANTGVPAGELAKLFVLGHQAYVRWRCPGVYCMGLVKQTKLPSSVDHIVVLQNEMSTLIRVENTLRNIADTANALALKKSGLSLREGKGKGRRLTVAPVGCDMKLLLGGAVPRRRRIKGSEEIDSETMESFSDRVL